MVPMGTALVCINSKYCTYIWLQRVMIGVYAQSVLYTVNDRP